MTGKRPNNESSELVGPLKLAVSIVLSEPLPANVVELSLKNARALQDTGPPKNVGTPANATDFTNEVTTRRKWSLHVVCVTAVAVVAFFLLAFWPRNRVAWADVLESLGKKPWIKLSSTEATEWYSAKHQLNAVKHENGSVIVFDLGNRQIDSFARSMPWGLAEATGKIYRSSITEDNRYGIDRGQAFLDALLTGDVMGVAGKELEIIGHARRDVNRNGTKLVEHRFTTKDKITNETILLVDATTSLPVEVKRTELNGTEFTQTIAYPIDGPLNVYDLGVPKSAEIVDLRPNDDVQQILDSVRRSRLEMDPYCAIVVESMHANPAANALMTYRVWKRQTKWRIEQGRTKGSPDSSTIDDVAQWWHRHMAQADTSLKAISDGQRECTFKPITGMEPDPKNPDFLLVKGYQKKILPFRGSKNPGTRHATILPDFVGYPGLWDSGCEIVPNPVDTSTRQRLPANTIRLDGPARRVQARYYLDPNRAFLAMRTEFGEPSNGEDEYVVSSSVDTLSSIQTPSGKWLPTLVRSNASSTFVADDGRVIVRDSYMHFFYRFDVQLTDDLFVIENIADEQ